MKCDIIFAISCLMVQVGERSGGMKIGAYQFTVTKDISANFNKVHTALQRAKKNDVRLMVFPECALTGYPSRDITSPAEVDFEKLEEVYVQLQDFADQNDIYVMAGTITNDNEKYYNTAMCFRPYQEPFHYRKRALWGWDQDNFDMGNEEGVLEIDGFKVGVRICFEVRFPEFFRELYDRQTDFNVILFYDVADFDDVERYDLIKAHIRTRAVENVTETLAVDAIAPYQTAPTALYGKSGQVLKELKRNTEDFLFFDLEKSTPNFGECGRIEVTNQIRNKT